MNRSDKGNTGIELRHQTDKDTTVHNWFNDSWNNNCKCQKVTIFSPQLNGTIGVYMYKKISIEIQCFYDTERIGVDKLFLNIKGGVLT